MERRSAISLDIFARSVLAMLAMLADRVQKGDLWCLCLKSEEKRSLLMNTGEQPVLLTS